MSFAEIDRLVRSALAPEHFVLRAGVRLALHDEPPTELPFEIYLGHLFGAGRTRETRRLAGWRLSIASNTGADSPGTPLVRVHHDADASQLYVVRDLLVHGWESRETAPGTITSTPAEIWQPELVGALDLERRPTPDVAVAELRRLVELALVGTSRLPITSVESPLPVFATGEVAYLPVATADSTPRDAVPAWRDALERGLAAGDDARGARGLEFALRTCDPHDVERLAEQVVRAVPADRFGRWWRTMFQQISLAPHTSLLARVVELLACIARADRFGLPFGVDLVGYMLRHLARHLNAYDLVTFHSFGANYPDALWLDALLERYVAWIEAAPSEFLGADAAGSHARRLRRRALRQAWLVRLRYAGLLVPDAPTSQGERLRVSTTGESPPPEEQLTDPTTRRRRLFADERLAELRRGATAETLRAAWDELDDVRELRELGAATFVDRPLGIFKDAGEVDRTPFLAYEAFSARRAGERVRLAGEAQLLDEAAVARHLALLADEQAVAGPGVRASDLPSEPRPGVIMLEDARRASDDFVFRRTTRGSLAAWADLAEGLTPAQCATLRDWAATPDGVLLIRTSGPGPAARGRPLLTRYDASGTPLDVVRVIPPGVGEPVYREAFGVEYLSGGLRFESLPSA